MTRCGLEPVGDSGCRANTEFWAISQASPLQLVNTIGGRLTFMDSCTAGPHYASGGFMADSSVGERGRTVFFPNGLR